MLTSVSVHTEKGVNCITVPTEKAVNRCQCPYTKVQARVGVRTGKGSADTCQCAYTKLFTGINQFLSIGVLKDVNVST